jgi:hypothetical protein
MIITTNNIIICRKYASINYKDYACILHASSGGSEQATTHFIVLLCNIGDN